MSYTLGRLHGQFVLVYRSSDGKRHRYRLGTTDQSKARAAAPAVYAELTRSKGNTIRELWDAYLEDKRGRAITTTMATTWKALEQCFGPLHADEVGDYTCKAHIEHRRKSGRRDWTIYTELGHLRMVLNWAKQRGRIRDVPHIERPPEPRTVKRRLTRNEVKRLVDAAELPHVGLYITLLYATAARSSALTELTWERVDLARGLIDLRNPEITRPHKGRAIVKMNDSARAALLAAHAGALTKHVIEWGGKPVKKVRRALATAARKANLGKVNPHMLRHTAATHLAESGTGMEEIAQFLGHTNVATTRKLYAHYSPEYLAKAAKALEL